MKFDEYMHDSMKEIAQDVQPDPQNAGACHERRTD